MKAQDFWKFLCEEMGYRFFAGVPCMGFKTLYGSMSPRFMHYIPAVRENIALGLANGSYLAGTKSAVIMNLDRLYNLLDWLTSFNCEHSVPVLILAYRDSYDEKMISALASYGIPHKVLVSVEKDIKSLLKKMDKLGLPGIAIIEEGVLE